MKKINILKHYKLYSALLFLFVILIYISWMYIDILKYNKDELENSIHMQTAKLMHQKVDSEILKKQKSTIAFAISIANDESLTKKSFSGDISETYYKKLIRNYKEKTVYKNIWIQIVDKEGTSLYRSWSNKRGDNLLKVRKDLAHVFMTKKVLFSTSIGLFDLSLKVIIPIFKEGGFVGVLEVISRFNSISLHLKEYQINSVVVAKKEYRKQLKYPFSKKFIDDYYVSNLDAPKDLMNYLKNNGVENYFNDSYMVENGYVIASHALSGWDNIPIGYFIMFKKIDDVSSVDLDFFVFKWFTIVIVVFMSIAIIVGTVLFYIHRKDRKYYKNIINTSKNIIIVCDEKEIIQVNRTFFRYFDSYTTLEQFKDKHRSISDFFISEEGYLREDMDGVRWVDFMIEKSEESHKIKLKILDKEYYFSASAAVIDEENRQCAVIMSNISEQENYKKKLEYTTITDSLTQIRNRHYYKEEIKKEATRANRYFYSLSLIIFDIDYFKQVNDSYGHNIGDTVLIEYTKLISSFLRKSDIFCRIGGEEFTLILPHTNKADAYKIADKLRTKVEEYKKVVPVTMSFGVVEYVRGEDTEFTFKRADEALYEAKNSGRNRVIVK